MYRDNILYAESLNQFFLKKNWSNMNVCTFFWKGPDKYQNKLKFWRLKTYLDFTK